MTARDKCPAHYCFSDLQPWDVIDAWGLDYYLGNVLKYICRAGRKSPDVLADLNKALHYLQKEVELAERELAESCAFSRTTEDATEDTMEDTMEDTTEDTLECPYCGSKKTSSDNGDHVCLDCKRWWEDEEECVDIPCPRCGEKALIEISGEILTPRASFAATCSNCGGLWINLEKEGF